MAGGAQVSPDGTPGQVEQAARGGGTDGEHGVVKGLVTLEGRRNVAVLTPQS